MSISLMFDTETLGVREGAAVATIACVPFSFENPQSYQELVENGFFVKLSLQDQIKTWGRKTEKGALQFWSEQPKEARRNSIIPSDSDKSTEEALDLLTEFIKGSGYDFKKSYVWCRGIWFDFTKLEAQYEMVGKPCPFNSWKARDVRTFIDIFTGSDMGKYDLRGGEPGGFVKHHALHDAAIDAARLIEIFNLVKNGEL